MTEQFERRVPDRRSTPRGGRRPVDMDGVAPLIMVVGQHDPAGDPTSVVLAKLKFAVALVPDADDAVRVLGTMRPDLIVAGAEDAARIRAELPETPAIVTLTDRMSRDPDALVEAIRTALRAR